MKENTHPEYRDVCFVDMSTGKKYLCGSAVKTSQTEEFEGKSYPSVKVSISSSSHPFYTGDTKFVDTEGRVDKFKKKYGAKAAAVSEAPAKKEQK
ncbi:MAG: 50S ribosomal protein L31 type B [Chlamydiia bacterium]|nr:50S ribosomal protein L31 type B [Chlamydiia bacterium]MCH9617955.1 50S ribosomal protein L31 type B [Chlamydiia bacterium]MCH9623720.1 50S ribosomal protein L31 type B [Chlamydiia bacterium]